MSWDDYKKRREQLSSNNSSIKTNTSISNNNIAPINNRSSNTSYISNSSNQNSSSSWDAYKQRREQQAAEEEKKKKQEEAKKQQQEVAKKKEENNNITNSKYSLNTQSAPLVINGKVINTNNIQKPTTTATLEEKPTVSADGKSIIMPSGKTFEYTDKLANELNQMETSKKQAKTVRNIFEDINKGASNLYKGAETGVLNLLNFADLTTKTVENRVDDMYDNAGGLKKTLLSFTPIGQVKAISEIKKKAYDVLPENMQNNVDNLYKSSKEIITDEKAENQKEIEKNIETSSNKVTKKINELAPSIGNNLVGMGVSALNPVAGTAYFVGSAGGSYYDEGLQKGMTEDEAYNYATIMGGFEGITDQLLNAKLVKNVAKIGKEAVKETGKAVAKKAGKHAVENGFKAATKAFGIEIGENFIQEAVMPSLSELTTLGVAGTEHLKNDYTTKEGWQNLLNDSWQDGVDGALSSILLGGTMRGVKSANELSNKIKAGKQPTLQEIQTVVKDSQAAGVDVEALTQESIVKAAENKIQAQTQQQDPIQEQAQQEAAKIMDQVNQDLEQQKQAETEQQITELENKINEKQQQLNPLQQQLEDENTVKYQDQIAKHEQTKAEIQNNTTLTDEQKQLVINSLDNQIEKLKTETQEMTQPTPATQEMVEQEGSRNAQTINDENIEPTDLNLTDAEKEELQVYDEVVSKNGVEILDKDSKQRYEYLKRAEQNGEIAPVNNDVAISEDTTDISTKIKETFDLNNKETKDLYNKVANSNSVEQVRAALEDYKAINEKVVDDTVREIKKTIKNTKLDVSQLKNQVTDYNDFRKANFGNLRIGNDGMSVDTFYQELTELYPDYFSSDVTNVADQLEAITDFAKNNKAEYTQQIGEISNDDLNQLANELYAEVHAKEFNKFTDEQGAYKNVNDIVDKEALKEELKQEVRTQVQTLKDEIKTFEKQLSEIKAPIKEAVKELNQVKKQVTDNLTEQTTNKAPIKAETTQTQQTIPLKENVAQNQNMTVTSDNTNIAPLQEQTKKVMNPTEIANLTPEEASTTPKLPNKKVVSGDKESSFYKNITETSQAYSEEMRNVIANEDDVKYYQGITNEETLAKAKQRLDEGGSAETLRWLTDKWTNEKGKQVKHITAVDVAEGWILLKQYQDAGDYESAVQVAKKMREMGTTSGQAVQAFNIMSRLTPEGMTKFAQSELSEAFERLSKNKTKEWIDSNRASFDLTGDEAKFISDTMKDIQDMNSIDYISNRKSRLEADLQNATDKAEIKNIKQELSLLNKGNTEYLKKAKLAEIQQMMADKLPPSAGQSLKAWMRISMLFNPKTQVRNVLGNAVIMPVNFVSDVVATGVDKAISKQTGVRTKGLPNLKASTKGFAGGITESVRDYQRGINTREMQGDRFEIKEGKNFRERTVIGKILNRIDNLNSFLLDVGDRGFYNLAYKNSIDRQLKLNNTDTITQDMINIATNEALERTWQDNNNYTRFVLNVREGLNKVGVKDYGLGDVLIPFAKTPANLTKAIVDYSPAGMINTIVDGVKLNRSLKNGQFDAQMQHKFAQDLGKATAGTMLYIAGYALAKAGITSGEGEDDKDVSNFLKNVLGVNKYSIEIGGHSFTYDWAQPIAAPFAMMANIVEGSKESKSLGELVTSSLNTAGNLILKQSFMDSINTVLTNQEGLFSGLQEAILGLPARAIPTFSKQLADMADSTTRQQFVKDKPLESAKNSILAKIPFASKTLAPSVDTLGNEIQKYGGENTIYNVFFNPSTVNAENLSTAGNEIYRVYNETKDATIMPRVAPYSIKKGDETIQLSAQQRADFQKLSGGIVESNVNELINSRTYKNMSDENKAKVLTDISNYAYNKAQEQIVGTELADTYKNVDNFVNIGGTVEEYYTFTNSVDGTNKETKKTSVVNTLLNMNMTDQQKAQLYDKYYSSEETLNKILDKGASFNSYLTYEKNTYKMEKDDEKTNYLKSSYMSDVDKTAIYEATILSDFDDEDKYKTYKTAKAANIDINTWLDYSSQEFTADKNSNGKTVSGSRKNKVVSYINSLDLNIPQKAILIRSEYSSFRDYNNQIVSYVNGLDLTISEKTKILENLDMTVSNGRVSWK